MNEEQEVQAAPTQAEEVVEEVKEEVVETETKEEVDLRAELEKAREIAENQRIRAEKAEQKAKAIVKPALSSGDLLAVTNAKVHEDDIEKLERYAKAENLTIKEALRDPEWQAIQALRDENRRVADAANISNVRAGKVSVSDDALLEKAAQGKLPENDLEIERLIQAKARSTQG